MNIPFLSLFKKKAAKAPAAAAPAPAPVDKPSSERLSKTVVPNATRTVPSQDPHTPVAIAPAPAAARTVAFAPSGPASRSQGLPPAVALALEPTVERVITLELMDVVRGIPAGVVRPLENDDVDRRILLKAGEVEKGMSSGRPTVSLASIYQQVPEIFVREIPPSNTTMVQLPFAKCLEQFTSLQVRSDQRRERTVPQVETPFLKVSLEDNTRFGSTCEALPPEEPPAVRVEAATAEALAKAEPEAAARAKTPAPAAAPKAFSLRTATAAEPKSNGNGNGSGSAAAKPAPAPAPARIPFKLTTNGTDVPATERVPASNGPSVPTSSPAPSAPTRIPFKVSPPSDDLRKVSPPSDDARPKAEPWLTKENTEPKTIPAPKIAVIAPPEKMASPKLETPKTGPMVSLRLKPILASLPAFQLTGGIDDVPNDARIDLPFALIEPQLATGRVVLNPDEFAAQLPAEYRGLFDPSETAALVPLPLQEVLKNLPSTSLRMRDDQVEQEKGASFATPFSAKAEEDAKRFAAAQAAVAAAVVPVAEPDAEPEPIESVEPEAEEVPAARTALQEALDTDETLDAKGVVAHVGKLEGVKACAIMFGDGLSLAGSLPEEFGADGLCAAAPSLLQRVENHLVDTKLGGLRAMTLSCAKAAVTFFMHDNLCLGALHEKGELAAEVHERLARVVHELSRTYSQPA